MIEELRQMPPTDGVTMLSELVDLFLDGAPQRLAQIGQFLGDPVKLAFHAHALKSMSLNLGARRVVQLSQLLEDAGRSGNLEGAGALYQELQAAFAQTRSQLLPLRDAR
jgi:HPt (histidine-containing phosphotransfer) domain-containing protein